MDHGKQDNSGKTPRENNKWALNPPEPPIQGDVYLDTAHAQTWYDAIITQPKVGENDKAEGGRASRSRSGSTRRSRKLAMSPRTSKIRARRVKKPATSAGSLSRMRTNDIFASTSWGNIPSKRRRSIAACRNRSSAPSRRRRRSATRKVSASLPKNTRIG